MDDKIFKLITDLGPNSSDAIMYYVLADLFGTLLHASVWAGLIYTVYKLIVITFNLSPVNNSLYKIRSILSPHIKGEITNLEAKALVRDVEELKKAYDTFKANQMK